MNTVTVTFGTAPRDVLRLRRAVEVVKHVRYSIYDVHRWLAASTVHVMNLSDEQALRLMDALAEMYAGTDHKVELSEEPR